MFNPNLEGALRFIHPIQIKSITKFLGQPFSEHIDIIILFGGSLDLSCGIDSDLDFYVISEYDAEAIYKEIYDRCKGLGRPFDILVSQREDFISEALEFGTVEHKIVQEGLCLYAKAENNVT